MYIKDGAIVIPSKSFIVGEYLVLRGGGALVWLHEPSFTLAPVNEFLKIHKDSPAGKLFSLFHRSAEVSDQKLKTSLEATTVATMEGDQICIKLSDPHKGAGGYGRSTAEFLAVLYVCGLNFRCFPVELTWLTEITKIFNMSKGEKAKVAQKMWTLYKEITRSKNEYNPSGIDLAAQLFAEEEGIVVVSQDPFYVNTYKWPFEEEAELKTIATKNKLDTHTHLENLDKFSCAGFTESFNKTLRGLTTESLELFSEGINEYQRALVIEGLQDEKSKILVDKALSSGAIAAKGCGAMGADTYLTVSKV